MYLENKPIKVSGMSSTPGLYTGEGKTVPHGHGVCVFEDGTKYDGQWEKGMPEGEGKLTYSDGTWEEGEFCMGHFMEGQVLKRLYTGCIYEGGYEYPDILCGGILRYPDGRSYTGEYDEVYPHGQGKMTYPGGAYFTGSFDCNVAHGKGVFNFPDGSSEEAEFINGRLIAGGARTLALLKLQPEDLLTGPLPCLTVKREYSTFGGGQFGIYRFPVRVGVIPFTDMVMLEATEDAAGKFEITAVTDDSVSFVVPGEYFADKLPQIHTLSLAGEKKVFEHIEEGWATIYETVHDYETLHRITVSTEKD